MLFNVSIRLNKTDLKRLGLKLNVPAHVIEVVLDDANALSTAAHTVLQDWFKRQDNREGAYQALGQALRDAQLNLIANDVLQYLS